MIDRPLRFARSATLAACLLLSLTGQAAAQSPAFPNANFERAGVRAQWTSNFGGVSESLRVCAEPDASVRLDQVRINGRALVTLGGDYWKVPVKVPSTVTSAYGVEGKCVLRVKGILPIRSPAFKASKRYLSVLARSEAGGTLEVRGAETKGEPVNGDAVVSKKLARGTVMERIVFDLGPAGSANRTRTVALVVSMKSGSVEIDDVRLWTTPPPTIVSGFPIAKKVWGFADLHVHVNAHQAMGGLRGINTMWGAPGGRYADYVANPSLYEKDIPACDGFAHNGGALAPILVNAMELRLSSAAAGADKLDFWQVPGSASSAMAQSILFHDRGRPHTKREGEFGAGMHNQQHIVAIRRSFDGGLRLMSSLAVNNELLEYVMAPATAAGTRLTPALDVIKAHVCAMTQLASLNSDWMEIAKTPEDAQRIIAQNKLAIILGIEVADLGNLGFPTIEAEVQHLHDLGIRQVTVTHAMDNKLAGAAVYEEVYNFTNDLLSRAPSVRGAPIDQISRLPSGFYRMRAASCHEDYVVKVDSGGRVVRGPNGRPVMVANPYKGKRGECVLRQLSPLGMRVGIDRNLDNIDTLINAVLKSNVATARQDAVDAVGGFPRNDPTVAGVAKWAGKAVEKTGHWMGQTIIQALGMAAVGALKVFGLFRGVLALLSGQANLYHPFAIHTDLSSTAPNNRAADAYLYDLIKGHLSAKTITPLGKRYVNALMDRGMLVDVSHLSDLARTAVFSLARKRGAPSVSFDETRPEGGRSDELAAAYPIMWSHVKFRSQAFHTTPLPNVETYLPREMDIANSQVRFIQGSGGMIGLFLAMDPLEISVDDQQRWKMANNCGGSTKSFSFAYLHALEMMGSRGIALGTDAQFHPMSPPRFGEHACLHNGDGIRKAPQMYSQRNWVRYAGAPARPWYVPADADRPERTITGLPRGFRFRPFIPNEPLDPFHLSGRKYDYNTEGWANYGLIPDALQDARNVGLTQAELAPLFRSAQDYVDMWTKARRVSGCVAGRKCLSAPLRLDCSDSGACKGTCPKSPSRGAPVVRKRYGSADFNRAIGAFSHDPWDDTEAAILRASTMRARRPDDAQRLCEAANWGTCTGPLVQSCSHRKNVCQGLVGAKLWSRCEADPNNPFPGDSFHGRPIRRGACLAARALARGEPRPCAGMSYTESGDASAYDSWLAYKTCVQVWNQLDFTRP